MRAEEVFREANESVAAKAGELKFAHPLPFLCECRDRHCFARISLTLEEYEHCLLYTSPSPRDGLLSRMPSSA